MYCDLHTHSTASDGTYTPTELIAAAESAGLYAVALCDHNTVAGLSEFYEAAKGRNICAIPGVEISTEYQGIELHVLGLFLPCAAWSEVTAFVEKMNERKQKSNRALVERLKTAGYRIDYDEIVGATPGGHINRAHIAAALCHGGYVPSVQQAFDTLLLAKHGFYVPPKRLDAFETIEFLRAAGAVPVLAHPFLSLDETTLRAFLGQAVSRGLVGMETQYSRYTEQTQKTAQTIAREFGLLESGGSDFHGQNKPDIALGAGLGDLRVSYELARRLSESR